MDVRPLRAIGWRVGGRHLGCGGRFELSRARAGGGPQASRALRLSGQGTAGWATSSLVDALVKAIVRGFWERLLARGGTPPNRRRIVLVPSSIAARKRQRVSVLAPGWGKSTYGAVGCRGGGRDGPCVRSGPLGWESAAGVLRKEGVIRRAAGSLAAANDGVGGLLVVPLVPYNCRS